MHAGALGTFYFGEHCLGVGQNFLGRYAIAGEKRLRIFIACETLVRQRFDLDDLSRFNRQRRRQVGSDIAPENGVGSRKELGVGRDGPWIEAMRGCVNRSRGIFAHTRK